MDDARGYYLIGFDTSLAPGVRTDPADVKITTLRPGLQIRARRGRFGPANPDDGPLPRPGDSLVAAVMSPLSTGALDVRLTALFGHDAQGAHVRAVVDLDPAGLVLANTDGRREADLTLLTLRSTIPARSSRSPSSRSRSASTPRPTAGHARTACVTASACR